METIKLFLIICLFLFVLILFFNFYLGYKKGDNSGTEKSVESRSLGLLGVLDPKDASDLRPQFGGRLAEVRVCCLRINCTVVAQTERNVPGLFSAS